MTKTWEQARSNRESLYAKVSDVKLDVRDVRVKPARAVGGGRHLPLGAVADRRRAARARDRAPDHRLPEGRRRVEDRPHAHLARQARPLAPPALRAHDDDHARRTASREAVRPPLDYPDERRRPESWAEPLRAPLHLPFSRSPKSIEESLLVAPSNPRRLTLP